MKKRPVMQRFAKLMMVHLLFSKQGRKHAKAARKARIKLAKKRARKRKGTASGAVLAMAKTALITRELAPGQGIRANVKQTVAQQTVPALKKQVRKRAAKPALRAVRAGVVMSAAAGTQIARIMRER